MPESAPRVVGEAALFEMKRPRWQAQAACRPDVCPHVWQQFDDCRSPTDLFFPGRGPTDERLEAIASVCDTCPVSEECYAHGLKFENVGFWGGRNQTQMAVDRRERGLPLRGVAPEVDPDTRKVIGTFIPAVHGTPERYNIHMKAGEKACEMCLSAHREFYKPAAAAEWRDKKATETPAQRAERNQQERERRERHKQAGTLCYRG